MFVLQTEESTHASSSKGIKASQRGQGLNFDASRRDLCNVGYFHNSATGVAPDVVRSFWLFCTLPRLSSRQVCLWNCFQRRISVCRALLRQQLTGVWKRWSLGSYSHVASCAPSCACRGLITIPRASLSGVQEESHPCLPAPEQGEHHLAEVTHLPAAPGTVFLPARGGRVTVAGWVVTSLLLFIYAGKHY